MACPLCGDQCRCSAPAADASHVSVLIDPEHFEDSEAQFASTVSDADDSLAHDLPALAMNEGDVHDVFASSAFRKDSPDPLGAFGSGTPIVTPRLEAANVTTTLVEAATTEPPQFYRPPEPPVWRDEVTSRVDAYQAKRGRGRRYDPGGSLSLNFEAMPQQQESAPPARYAAVRLDMVDHAETAASEGKLIEFPKPMPVASVTELPPLPHVEELAEPMVETPRILDVPEGAHPLTEQPLADIQLQAERAPALDYIAQSVDLPLPIAGIGPRVGAGMVDMLIVLTAAAIFGMI